MSDDFETVRPHDIQNLRMFLEGEDARAELAALARIEAENEELRRSNAVLKGALEAADEQYERLEAELDRHSNNNCIRELEQMVEEADERANELGREVERLRAALEDAADALDEGYLDLPDPVCRALVDYYGSSTEPWWMSLVDRETYERQEAARDRARRALEGSSDE